MVTLASKGVFPFSFHFLAHTHFLLSILLHKNNETRVNFVVIVTFGVVIVTLVVVVAVFVVVVVVAGAVAVAAATQKCIPRAVSEQRFSSSTSIPNAHTLTHTYAHTCHSYAQALT